MRLIDTLDIYLEDIPGPLAQGKDLKYDAIYDDIQEAGREELDLPQGVWVKDVKLADWKKVESLATDILTKQSKDLQIAAWLVKAWMYLYQVEGLEKGLALLLKLSQKYWENAYPQIVLDDPEYRAGPYNWINEKLSDHLNQLPITNPTDKDAQIYTLAAYIDTHYMADAPPAATQQISAQEKKALELKTSIKKSNIVFFEQLATSIKNGKDNIQELQAFLDEKMKKGSPSLYRVREKLDQLEQYAHTILGEKQEELKKAAPKETVETVALKPVQADAPSSLDDVIHSRAEAYAIIEKAADYLAKLDPHSPAPYLIKRAVRWGSLSFEDLLKEMVADPNSVTELRRLLGVGGNTSGSFIGNPSPNQGNNTAPSATAPVQPFWKIEE